jgi:hypothetical protein
MGALFTEPGDPISSTGNLLIRTAKFPGALYLRGVPDEAWTLRTSIALLCQRKVAGKPVPVSKDTALVQEKALLHRFRRHTYEERGRVLSEWESLFLARHHGLPVRLLDWTTNPLVALYFACICGEEPSTNGAIWLFERTYDVPEIDVFKVKSPFDIEGVRIVQPFYPTRKMTAQSGLFTIHGDPWEDLDKLVPGSFETDILRGEKWVVCREAKQSIVAELMRLGISARTLFPDLSGLVRGLIETEAFRKPEYDKASFKAFV